MPNEYAFGGAPDSRDAAYPTGAVTVGSDAHRSEWFAYGLGEAYRLVVGAGFDALAFRRGGERESVPIVPRRLS